MATYRSNVIRASVYTMPHLVTLIVHVTVRRESKRGKIKRRRAVVVLDLHLGKFPARQEPLGALLYNPEGHLVEGVDPEWQDAALEAVSARLGVELVRGQFLDPPTTTELLEAVEEIKRIGIEEAD